METFTTFMEHLILEFSSENLLCLTEMMQYRTLYARLCNVEESREVPAALVSLPLSHPSFPQSRIVFNDKYEGRETSADGGDGDNDSDTNDARLSVECVKYVIRTLIQKYVLIGASLEINLAHSMHIKYQNMFDDADDAYFEALVRNAAQLVRVFDPVISACISLMTDSYHRFLSKPDYAKCVAYIQQRKSFANEDV